MRNLLEAAAKSDARNEALLKGLKLAHEDQQKLIANEKAQLRTDKEELEIYRQALKDKEV